MTVHMTLSSHGHRGGFFSPPRSLLLLLLLLLLLYIVRVFHHTDRLATTRLLLASPPPLPIETGGSFRHTIAGIRDDGLSLFYIIIIIFFLYAYSPPLVRHYFLTPPMEICAVR